MCGIVGYFGDEEATPILEEGLERLSYRGYDSAGIAVLSDEGKMQVYKAKGSLENLQEVLKNKNLSGTVGIGHTRWATHGEPSDINAQPHTDVAAGIAVVHNGIIENHEELRAYLESEGIRFVSQTDTEVIAHLLSWLYNGDMQSTLLKALGMIEGSYALGVVCEMEPNKLFCARCDSPLILGKDGDNLFIASDIPAILKHTRDVIFLNDKEVGILSKEGIKVINAYGKEQKHEYFHVTWDLDSAEKGGYAHYMLKEIFEQPEVLHKTYGICKKTEDNNIDTSWFPLTAQEAKSIKKITIVACGTASYAGQLGKEAIEKLTRIKTDVVIASEYRYSNPIVCDDEWVIAVSQSGETADTLAAVKEAKRLGAKAMAICNVLGSSLTREVGEKHTLYTLAGPEISVASTKAYVTQVALLQLIALSLATLRETQPKEELLALHTAMQEMPALAEKALKTYKDIQRFSSTVSEKKHAFFVGRGADYALSMEAALKLKEVSYIFSEAYASGELKHGPIALLKEGRLVVGILTQPKLLDKSLSNLQEVAARGAKIFAVCCEGLKDRVEKHAKTVITVPDTNELLAPVLAVIPLQLFAYCMAVAKGCNVDKPRNLAKSVTVE